LKYPDLIIPREIPTDIFKNADIAHIHTQNSFFNIKLAEKAKRFGTKIAIHFMSVDALYDHPNILVRIMGPYYARYMLKKALSLAHLKLTRSLRDREILQRKYNVKSALFVPDGIDKEYITKKSLEKYFRSKYGIYEDIILYIGRLHKLKGLEILIKAVPYVVKEYKHIKFIIIGPGDAKLYKALARRLNVDNHVIFLGYVSENIKIGALDSSICLVLPSICSYVEVYPMVISEAWARKKPVIASKLGGIPYRVRHEKTGLLVSPRDSKSLANAILTLLTNRDLAKELGENGWKEIKTWDEIASMTIKLYQNIL